MSQIKRRKYTRKATPPVTPYRPTRAALAESLEDMKRTALAAHDSGQAISVQTAFTEADGPGKVAQITVSYVADPVRGRPIP